MSSLCRGLSARFRFLELATVGGRFYFSKWCLTCCQGGRHFDLLWGRAINPSKTSLFPHCFSSISRFFCYITCVWVCERGSPARVHFLELATVGGPFFFSKGVLTCCQWGRHFDLVWGRAINPSKNYLFRTVFSSISVFTLFKQCRVCAGVSRLGSDFLS